MLIVSDSSISGNTLCYLVSRPVKQSFNQEIVISRFDLKITVGSQNFLFFQKFTLLRHKFEYISRLTEMYVDIKVKICLSKQTRDSRCYYKNSVIADLLGYFERVGLLKV